MRELAEVMRPFTTGSDFVNQIGLETDEGSGRVKAAYVANYERLVAVKNKYDPTNLFRHNQNPIELTLVEIRVSAISTCPPFPPPTGDRPTIAPRPCPAAERSVLWV